MKMVRTSLLAAAAGVLISPVGLAAIVDDDGAGPSTTLFYSNEYLSTAVADSTVTSGALRTTLEAEYAVGDVVTLSVTGAAIEGGFPSSVIINCLADVRAGVTFGRLSSGPSGATYRVTEIDAGTCVNATTTVGITVTWSAGLTLDAQAVDAANTITASFSAQTNTGLPLDTDGGAARSGDLVVTGSQYVPSVDTAFDSIVDVNQQRLAFENGCCDSATWTVDWDAVPMGVDGSTLAAIPGAGVDDASQALTVAADFGWVADSDDVTAGIQPFADVFDTACTDVAVTATELTATCNVGTNSLDIDTSENGAAGNASALPATSFTSTHVLTFEGIGDVENSITVTGINLGAWGLNGFQAKVAYMPFQSGIGQVIYIANRSTQTGAITVDWIDQDGNSGSFDIGNVNAGSTRAIGPAIRAGLPAAQRAGGRLALVITANVPACQAQLNAQYNVSGDRAFSVSTNNCSNGRPE